MPANRTKRIIGIVVIGAIAALLIWFAWPRPLAVDLATIAKGPLEVTADDDGKTRVRHIYSISAPIGGKVLRISHPMGVQLASLHVGDQVTANETVVALMQPTPPAASRWCEVCGGKQSAWHERDTCDFGNKRDRDRARQARAGGRPKRCRQGYLASTRNHS
jgi:hypothetical protein